MQKKQIFLNPLRVTPEHAIHINRHRSHGPKDQHMLEREALVLERLMQEGYFDWK